MVRYLQIKFLIKAEFIGAITSIFTARMAGVSTGGGVFNPHPDSC
jgi:hypothetical protein